MIEKERIIWRSCLADSLSPGCHAGMIFLEFLVSELGRQGNIFSLLVISYPWSARETEC